MNIYIFISIVLFSYYGVNTLLNTNTNFNIKNLNFKDNSKNRITIDDYQKKNYDTKLLISPNPKSEFFKWSDINMNQNKNPNTWVKTTVLYDKKKFNTQYFKNDKKSQNFFTKASTNESHIDQSKEIIAKPIISSTTQNTEPPFNKGYIFHTIEDDEDHSSLYFVCPNLFPMLPSTNSNINKKKISFLFPLSNETNDAGLNTMKFTKISATNFERSSAYVVLNEI
jgi:hypothetical protein